MFLTANKPKNQKKVDLTSSAQLLNMASILQVEDAAEAGRNFMKTYMGCFMVECLQGR